MEQRLLGKSDIKVSVVTLGAWAIGGWMWGGQQEFDAIDAIKQSLDSGVTSIDTAPVYGFGLSEEIVGRAVAKVRDKVVILTKYGLRWDSEEGEYHFDTIAPDGAKAKIYKNSRKKSIIWECEQSLKRLGTDYIDLYQCHWRDHTTPIDETMEAMEKLLEQGKIRAAGVSNWTVEEMDEANRTIVLASNQPPFSMVNRAAEDDVIGYCREHDIGVVVYSPLQRGLLTGKITANYEFAEGDHRASSEFFSVENRRRVNAFLDEIRPIADAHGATLAQLVINWTIHRPGITAALVGARNVKQAEENAGAASFQLGADEMSRIDELLEGLKLEITTA